MYQYFGSQSLVRGLPLDQKLLDQLSEARSCINYLHTCFGFVRWGNFCRTELAGDCSLLAVSTQGNSEHPSSLIGVVVLIDRHDWDHFKYLRSTENRKSVFIVSQEL